MTYENADLELVRFETEDVLNTSTEEVTVKTTCYGEDPELPEDEF